MPLIHSSNILLSVCAEVSQTHLHQTHGRGLWRHSLLSPEQPFDKLSGDAIIDADMGTHWLGTDELQPLSQTQFTLFFVLLSFIGIQT